jgi:hypothetical protein
VILDKSLASAVLSLKQMPAFRNVSLRLIEDLAELATYADFDVTSSFEEIDPDVDLLIIFDGEVAIRAGKGPGARIDVVPAGNTYVLHGTGPLLHPLDAR